MCYMYAIIEKKAQKDTHPQNKLAMVDILN